uniref:BEN domain-containing protein n=1 Tax=Knipowitschia caucasica TaxID=637954 RepID=A0AAV2KH32_KNICA
MSIGGGGEVNRNTYSYVGKHLSVLGGGKNYYSSQVRALRLPFARHRGLWRSERLCYTESLMDNKPFRRPYSVSLRAITKKLEDTLTNGGSRIFKKSQRRLRSECDETSDEDHEPPRNWSSTLRQIKQLKSENKRLKESNYKQIVEAIRDLPAVVQNLRHITEQLSSFSKSSSAESTPVRLVRSEHLPVSSPASPQEESVDMVSLVPGSDVKVNKMKLNSLRTSNSSVYVGDLAVLIFGRETLASSSLTGRQSAAHKDVESKPQLDAAKLDAIVGYARSRFPSLSVQDIRKIIRKKCNNENFKKGSTAKQVDATQN